MFKESVAIFISVVLLLIAPHVQASGLSIGTGSQIVLNNGSLNVGGDVAITGTLTVGSGSLSLIGNWSNNGTFTAGTGTVTFTGTNQSISGATTFYNLNKSVTSAATLTFQNSSANKTTITNTLNLQGASGQLLSLRSDSTGSQWEIDPQGTRTIQYLDVKDSNNVGATNINAVGKNCTDSENNTKWSFTQLASGTYYVNIASGDDSSNGSSTNPWKTFHYAIDRINNGSAGSAENGYVLHILLGATYSTDNGEANKELAISQNYVTIIGELGSKPTISGPSSGDWQYGTKITGSHVTLKNLNITGFTRENRTGIEIVSGPEANSTNNTIDACRVYENYDGISISNSDDFTIQDSEIDNNDFDGISISNCTTQTSNGLITRNTIHDNYEIDHSDGIIVQSCNPEISRNKIYDNRFNISLQAYNSEVTSPTIKNNVIYEATSGEVDYGIIIGGTNTSTVSPKIYHNTIDKGTYEGIIVEKYLSSTISPEIKYNIITNFEQYGIQNNSGSPIISYNDVWNNGNSSADNYRDCTAGTGGISFDPKYGSYTLQSDSPCINAIDEDEAVEDPVIVDHPGFTRPRPGKTTKDMGAYEYIATQTYPDILPGGTGAVTDYCIFTIPLDIGTGLAMRNTMEGTLGAYDPTKWRVFAYTTNGDFEMNTQAFESLDIKPGMGFWLITLYTNTINFQGTLAPDGIYYKMELAPGWHLFAVPWPSTSIELGKIYVTDGVNQYEITNASNTLTEKYIWDYTGTGATGYTVRSTSNFSLVAGTGYFIKVLGNSNITLSIPPNNSSTPPNNSSLSSSHAMSYVSPESLRFPDDSEPPPLPSGSYGPMPDIKAMEKAGL